MLTAEMPPKIQPEDLVPGRYLECALAARGMSQTELSERMGHKPITVNRWCRGRTPFGLSRWYHALAALALPSDWLPGAPPPAPPASWQKPRPLTKREQARYAQIDCSRPEA